MTTIIRQQIITKLESKINSQPFNLYHNHLQQILKLWEKSLFGQHSCRKLAKKTRLTLGDRNKRFFNQKTKQQPPRNTIYGLKNYLDQWEEGPTRIKSMLLQSFKTRLSSSSPAQRQLDMSFLPEVVSDQEAIEIPFS